MLAELQKEVIAKGWFEPKVVYGYFRCYADGNDVCFYDMPETRQRDCERFTFPRQREGRKLSIADFFLPKNSGKFDVIGLSVVTIGARASEETKRLFEAGEFTKYLYLHGLSVETAEALAELFHKTDSRRAGHRGRRCAAELAICFIRSIADRAIRLAIRHARTWKTRPSCLRY